MRHSLPLALTLLTLSMLSSACAQPEPAPKDLDSLARFFLVKFAETEDPALSDQELQDAVAKLHDALGADDDAALAEPIDGVLTDLTQAELDATGVSGDPAEPQGMFIAGVVHCDLAMMKDILLVPDQDRLYPEVYTAYQRDFDPDPLPFLPTWTTSYSAQPTPGAGYSATTKAGMRSVPATETSEHGEVLVARVVLPEPGDFDSDANEFLFDFQIETYYERAAGELVHFYGAWRYMKLGILGDSHDGAFIDTTLKAMKDWDVRTDEICAGGGPDNFTAPPENG